MKCIPITLSGRFVTDAILVIDIDEVFDAFKYIQALTDTQDAVTLATYLTLKEFSEENVKYIELRLGSRR